MLEKLRKWEILVGSKISSNESRGIISVNGRKLKDRLQHRIKQEQNNLREYVNLLALETNAKITADLNHIKQVLSKDRNSLSTFVEYVAAVKSAQVRFDELLLEKKRLEDIKTTLNKFRAKDDSQSSFTGS